MADVEPPSDVTIGELYRLSIAMAKRLDDISARLENKMVTIDVYTLSHQALTDRVADLEKDLDHHKLDSERDQDRRRTVWVAVGASMLASLGSVAAALIALVK